MWHWQYPPICAFQTGVIQFVSLFMLHLWSAINPCICFIFNKSYRSGFKEIISARAGSLRITTGITSLRKRVTSSGSEGICLKVIEEDQEDKEYDEERQEEEQL